MNKMQNSIKLLCAIFFSTNPLKSYKIMFMDQFNVKDNKYYSYKKLIDAIRGKYEELIDLDKEKLFVEKTKVQDKIERAITTDISSLMLGFITGFVSIIVFVSGTPQDVNLRFKIGDLALYIVSGVFLLASIMSMGNIFRIKNAKGYNKICLEILNQIEKDMDNEEYIMRHKEADSKHYKKNLMNTVSVIEEKIDKKIKISILILIILVIVSLGWLWSTYSGFNYEYGKKVEMTFSFAGTIIGGLTTLIVMYYTVKQTRKIQQDNKKENNITKEIDNLKMQIEYCKNTFKYAYEYQLFLDDLDVEIERILRRTSFLSAEDTDGKESSSENVKHNNKYKVMQVEEEILSDLNIDNKVKNIYNKMEKYTKKIMIESSAVTNEEINKITVELFNMMIGNTEFIGEIVLNNENIDKAKEMIHDKDSDINGALELLNYFQFQLKDYIIECQERINTLISSDIKES